MKATTITLAVFLGHALADGVFTNPPAPPANSTVGACFQASLKVFDKCYEERKGKDEFKVDKELLEICNKQRDAAKEECLDAKLVGGQILDSATIAEIELAKKKRKCAVPGNRAYAACMKGRIVSKPASNDTTADCESKKKAASEACMKEEDAGDCEGGAEPAPADPNNTEAAKTIDEYCAARAAQSVIQFSKQYCLDAFARCRHKGVYLNDNRNATPCADKMIKDKPWHKKPQLTSSQSGTGTEPTQLPTRV